MKCVFSLFVLCITTLTSSAAEPTLKLLFLGDNASHRPEIRYRILQEAFRSRGIELSYTDQVSALNADTLNNYAGLIIYANHTRIEPAQEKALLDYVASGKGFIPLHCASFCFLNSQAYIDLVGAQFQKHGTGIFRVTPSVSDHPITKGFEGFESWDETYVHTKHNDKDRTILEYRTEGTNKEPWTWVRTHGKGRVFYTAWGHDERTWSNPGFQNLVERGVRWAIGQDVGQVPAYADQPAMVPLSKNTKPLEYIPAKVPFYPAGERWGTTAEPINKMPKPLPPEESVKHVSYPVGFELQLFVSDDQLGGKPISMNWDEQGRLWLAITVDYPNEMQPEGKGRDKILICEDTDQDGKADKFTVFADRLSIPTSLLPFQNGVIVHQAPHTLLLRDTNGDGKADETKILFTGWGTQDTHAGPSNLRYGPDGWIYGMVGYSGFEGTVGGKRMNFRQGFYRFKSDGSEIEFLRNTNNNSWGVGFSEEGLLFGSTANGCPSVYMPIANRYYEAVRGWSSSVLQSIAFENRYRPITDKIRQVDWHGGFTSAAGHALYTARKYPKEYWNRTAFVSDPTGHLTATFVLQKNGSDFLARYAWNLVAGDDEWFAPIMAEVGPDSNMWVMDWYNYIVQHNPTPQGFKTGKGNAYETDLRDKKHGRIYRLVYKDGKKEEPVTLKGATTAQQIAMLKHPNMFWRLMAQRMLVERNDVRIVKELLPLVEDSSVDPIGLNPGAMHALWTLAQINGSNNSDVSAVVQKAMKHPSAGVRRVAHQVSAQLLVSADSTMSEEPDPHVRLAKVLAFSERKPSADIADQIVALLSQANNVEDRWIKDALTAASAKHDTFVLQKILTSQTPLPSAAMSIVAITSEHFARRGGENLDVVILAMNQAPTAVVDVILTGMAKGWPKDKPVVLKPAAEETVGTLLSKLSPASQGNLIRLAALWGSKTLAKQAAQVAESLVKVVNDEKAKEEDRIRAAKQMIELQNADAAPVEKLLQIITPRTSPTLANGLLEAVSVSTATEVGQEILKRFAEWSPALRSTALRILLSRKESTKALLDALENKQIAFSELALDQKQTLMSYPDQALANRAKQLFAKGGGLPNADRQKVIEELASLLKKTGNAGLGKQAFTKHCANCHMHGNEGNKIGPDLTGMAVHPKEELLIHIMDPNRSVEGNFRIYNVTMLDGRNLSGLLASETKTSVELIDSQAKKYTLLREDIEQLKASTQSLMPEGFEKQMTPDEIINLLEFLTQRGKYVPIPLDKYATVISTKGMFYQEENPSERLILRDWKPRLIGDVPFVLVDPQGEKTPNMILLYGPNGKIPPKMPKSVELPCNMPVKAVHLLSGVGGWNYPASEKGSVTLIVRFHYDDGNKEDHELLNGEHFADYIRRIDVPGSKFAFAMRGQQMRYLTIEPKRDRTITKMELLKGKDNSAPVVMAVTLESR